MKNPLKTHLILKGCSACLIVLTHALVAVFVPTPAFLCRLCFLNFKVVMTTGIAAMTLNPAMTQARISMILISWHRLSPPETWLLNSPTLLGMPLFWHSTYCQIW